MLREHVLDLAVRVREACAERLGRIMGPESVSELPSVPQAVSTEDFPPPPNLDDPEAMERWQNTIAELSEVRGREEGVREGRKEGLREGEARGRKEGLREGREEGLREGEARGRRRLIRQLEIRFGPLPADKKTIVESGTTDELNTWAERLLTVASLDEVFQR